MSDPRQQAARQKRLAAALRANLKRRKEGARTSAPADTAAPSASTEKDAADHPAPSTNGDTSPKERS